MMATTIMISTSVKPAVLFVLICMTNLSVVSVRGVNDAKGGLLLLINLFTNCLLQPRFQTLVWCLRNSYTFVALKLAWGEAQRRECIPSDTRPTEQLSPRPISAQPEGRH